MVQVWRYYEIGEGILMPYVKPTFKCNGFEVIMPFSKTEMIARKNVKPSKLRNDRTLRNLFFCDVEGCSQVFEKLLDYEAHRIKGDHDTEKTKDVSSSSMDQVKKSYIAMMKMSSPKGPMMTGEAGNSHDLSMDMACAQFPTMESFQIEGWALPVRSTFRFSKPQKKILYEMFISGEKNNKKFTAQQAVEEIRSKLPVDEFVKAKQVKSLFSRWAKQYKEGSLNVDTILEEEEEIVADNVEEDSGGSANAIAFDEHVRMQTNLALDESEDGILFNDLYVRMCVQGFPWDFGEGGGGIFAF